MPQSLTGSAEQSHCLSVLSQAPASEVKSFADSLIPELGQIEVLQNRTGLAMLPMQDPVQGTTFYLGEVLLAEAHVSLVNHCVEGYAACLGRDVEHARAGCGTLLGCCHRTALGEATAARIVVSGTAAPTAECSFRDGCRVRRFIGKRASKIKENVDSHPPRS